MANRIINQEVEKPTVRFIKSFLAEPKYKEYMPDVGKYRSDALCWYGITKVLEARIKEVGDITKVIDEEIEDFRRCAAYVMEDLQSKGSKDQIRRMMLTVENFIARTVSESYD